jgi:hypothetical protein
MRNSYLLGISASPAMVKAAYFNVNGHRSTMSLTRY